MLFLTLVLQTAVEESERPSRGAMTLQEKNVHITVFTAVVLRATRKENKGIQMEGRIQYIAWRLVMQNPDESKEMY